MLNFYAVLAALVADAGGDVNFMGSVAVLGGEDGSAGYTLKEIWAALLVQGVYRARMAAKAEAELDARRAAGETIEFTPPPLSRGSSATRGRDGGGAKAGLWSTLTAGMNGKSRAQASAAAKSNIDDVRAVARGEG